MELSIFFIYKKFIQIDMIQIYTKLNQVVTKFFRGVSIMNILTRRFTSSTTPEATGDKQKETNGDKQNEDLKTLGNILKIKLADTSPEKLMQSCFDGVLSACRNREWSTIKRAHKLLANLQDEHKRSIFRALVEAEDYDTIKDILEQNLIPEPLASTDFRSTLSYIVKNRKPDLFLLIHKHVKRNQINQPNDQGQSLLDEASAEGKKDIVKMLIKSCPKLKKEWKSILNKLKTQQPRAFAWLNICAHLNSEAIPSEWLSQWLEKEQTLDSILIQQISRETLNTLREFGTIVWDETSKQFDLTDEVLQESLVQAQKKRKKFHRHNEALQIYKQALHILAEQNKRMKDKSDIWILSRSLLPHAESLLNNPFFQEISEEEQGALWLFTGRVKAEFADFQGALFALHQAVQIYQKHYDGKTKPNDELADALKNLGHAFELLGRFNEAQNYYEMALKSLQTKYGSDSHVDIAEALNNMGHIRELRGQLLDADDFYKQAWRMHVAIHDTDFHFDIVNSLCKLGRISQKLDNGQMGVYYLSAQDVLNKMSYSEEELVKVYCLMGHIMLILGKLEMKKNEDKEKLNQAKNFYMLALNKISNLHTNKAEHIIMVDCYNHLANIHMKLEEWESANLFYMEELQHVKKIYEPQEEHPRIAKVLYDLGSFYRRKGDVSSDPIGDFRKANLYYRQSLEMRIKIHQTENHPDVAFSHVGLASVWEARGKLDLAKKHYEKAYQIRRISYEELHAVHPDVARSLENLAGIFGDLGAYEESKDYYKKSLTMFCTIRGLDNGIFLAMYLIKLGDDGAQHNQPERAEREYQEALQMLREIFQSEDHPHVISVKEKIENLKKQPLQTEGNESN